MKVEEWPLFPDFEVRPNRCEENEFAIFFQNWKYPFAQVIFDDDPSRKDPSVTNQEQMEEMSEAVIK